MRETCKLQLPLLPNPIDHQHAKELEAIDQILKENPIIAELATQDLLGEDVSSRWGSPGMSGEQVVRCFIIKHMNDFSYDRLAFHVVDSISYRRFCLIGIGEKAPSRSTLQSNIRRLSQSTLEQMDECLVYIAADEGIEEGKSLRTDATATDANIHHPTDSSLLWDTVRVLVRLMKEAQELDDGIRFTDHSRRAKRRDLNVTNAAMKPKVRKRAYLDLFRVTERTINGAERVAACMVAFAQKAKWPASDQALGVAEEIRRVGALGRQVLSQARRRVINGEVVPAAEKIVSIFEPHADIIKKDNRETHFGHKIFLTTGSSSMVIDCVMPRGNPADSDWAETMVARAAGMFECTPRTVSLDGGFASKQNLARIKRLGVQEVCFNKRRGIAVKDMVSSTWLYKKLRDFRAGIEGIISFLKRGFGLDRCPDRGWPGFKRYVWRSIISFNLLIMARHRLAQT